MYLKSWWYDLQFLRIRVWQTKIGNYGSVFALLTPNPLPAKNAKNQNFEKMKKLLDISFYICVPKTTIRFPFWDRVRQTDFFVLLGHFLPFYPPNNPWNEKQKKDMKISSFYICVPKITIIWCMLPEIWLQHLTFCYFGSFFALLPQYWPPKIKNWKKNKEIFPFAHVHNE